MRSLEKQREISEKLARRILREDHNPLEVNWRSLDTHFTEYDRMLTMQNGLARRTRDYSGCGHSFWLENSENS